MVAKLRKAPKRALEKKHFSLVLFVKFKDLTPLTDCLRESLSLQGWPLQVAPMEGEFRA
jgi:hypothetical protein